METKELGLMEATDADVKFYLNAVRGLPQLDGFLGTGKDRHGIPIDFGIGPHSVRSLRSVFEIVKPRRILEIGFNMGYSSAVWLELMSEHFGTAPFNIVTTDITDKWETWAAAGILHERYPESFRYIRRTPTRRFPYSYDLAFIDGDHLYKSVQEDIAFSRRLGVRNIAFDDWLPEFGEAQKAALDTQGLTVTHVFGNIALATLG